MTWPEDPHGDQPALTAGIQLADAAMAVILLHGRGATAEGMLGLAGELDQESAAYVAPQAAQGTWYPQRFLAPLADNEPWLSSAVERVEQLVQDAHAAGIPAERVMLLGFSQGACLALEVLARLPRRYGAVAALTGGLPGPEHEARVLSGDLQGTPVFLGTSDPDPHVPYARVVETAATLRRHGAAVELRRYPGLPHTITADELDVVRSLQQRLLAQPGVAKVAAASTV